jgi:hypothetical protein
VKSRKAFQALRDFLGEEFSCVYIITHII